MWGWGMGTGRDGRMHRNLRDEAFGLVTGRNERQLQDPDSPGGAAIFAGPPPSGNQSLRPTSYPRSATRPLHSTRKA